MQRLKKQLPNILIIVFLAFGLFAAVGNANALAPSTQKQGDGTPFTQLAPGEGETGLNPDDVWLQWANYEATEFWKYSYCIATEANYNDHDACQTGDPNWTGTYNLKYVRLTNLQPNTDYVWRVKVVRCEVSDCTEKEHIISHSDFFTFSTGADNWLKVSGRAGKDPGILVNFYNSDEDKTYSIITGANGYYTISVPFGSTGTLYPRMHPDQWVYGDPLYDTRFSPTFRYYDSIEENLVDQNFASANQVTVSGKTDHIQGVRINFVYTGVFKDSNGNPVEPGDAGYDQLLAAYTFTTYSDKDGNYSQGLPKEWMGTIYIHGAEGEGDPWEGTNPYFNDDQVDLAAYEVIDYSSFDPLYYSVPQLLSDKTGYNLNLNFVKISGHTDNLEAIEVTFTGIGDFVGDDFTAESDKYGYYYQYVPKGWTGTVSVDPSVVVDTTTYYWSPTTYTLNPVLKDSYGWSFFKTKVAP